MGGASGTLEKKTSFGIRGQGWLFWLCYSLYFKIGYVFFLHFL